MECPAPCDKVLTIEIIGEAKNFRMDGRLIRDVVGCARVDIFKLTDDDEKIEIKLYKPLPRGDELMNPRAKGTHRKPRSRSPAGADSSPQGKGGGGGKSKRDPRAASATSALSKASDATTTSAVSGTSDTSRFVAAGRRLKRRPSSIFDEEQLAEPSEEVIGVIHATLKRALQESSADVEGLGSAVNEIWHSDVDAYMYDQVAEQLDLLVEENSKRQNPDTRLNQLWQDLDWNTSGLVSIAAIDKLIAEKFGVLQNIDTLIL